ncbi:cell division protein FtsZ [Parabacteroides sp. PFB2-10]|uniref:cell division protein FtsZ n=1 Tax=Parabacteroides sp. PFB2-10 TaxID=1742405 RepID=UPI002473ADC1|nr:cell division protein FtsZ [Parabacteroides sp. PFB2-10]MDH6311281.1 cell division protein FtsZ [Parabacteroides sp. PFB2-10]
MLMEDMMEFNLPKNRMSNIIKVVGVGGGGGNAVENMYKQGIYDVSFAICNTDSQSLSKSSVPERIQLGDSGLGVGNKPDKGREAAEESIEEIKTLFTDGTKMVFITAGMGGGTGTGSAPVVAGVAKNMGILTIGIVTIPFLFEKKAKIRQAIKGVSEMRKQVDALLVINNERLLDLYGGGDMPAKVAFKKADDILTVAAKSIAEIITIHGDINRDFRDIETVMRNGGGAIMTVGKANGKHRLRHAIMDSLQSPLLNGKDIEKAKRILFVIYSNENHPVTVNELTELDHFMDELDPNIEVIWGLYDDNELDDEIKFTLIATGFETEEESVSVKVSEEDQCDALIAKYYPPKETLNPTSKIEQQPIQEIEPKQGDTPLFTNENIPQEKKPLIERLSDILNKLMDDNNL